MKAHFERHFDGTRAVVGEKTFRQARRCDRDQSFGQADGRFVREPGQQHLFELLYLRFHRGIDPRMAVAEEIDPPRADGVEIAPAVEVLKPDAAPASNRDHGEAFVILHLGAGVP